MKFCMKCGTLIYRIEQSPKMEEVVTMSNNDRVTKAIDNLIDALSELRDAWTEQQEVMPSKAIISDEPQTEIIIPEEKEEILLETEPLKDEDAESFLGGPPLISFEEDFKDNDESQPAPSQTPEKLSEQTVSPAPKMQAAIEPINKLSSEAEGKKCSNCGATSRISSKFCMNCGQKF